MELRDYTKPVLKWWWLILIAMALAVGLSKVVMDRQQQVYRSTATLLIGQSITNPNPRSEDLWLSQQLASMYASMAYREPVRQAVMDKLGMQGWLPPYEVNPIPNSQLLEIAVIDTDPQRAQRVADALAVQLEAESPGNTLTAEENQRYQFIQEQMSQLETDIRETQAELAEKQLAIAELTSAREIAEAEADVQALQTRLGLLQGNYATLLSNSGQQATNIARVIERASTGVPTGPNKYLIIALAGLIAGVLGVATSFLLEYLDDTLEDPEEVTRVTGLPVVGFIGEIPKKLARPVVQEQPRSPQAESFRNLRANLDAQRKESGLQVVVISSAEPSEGKTTLSINLALSLAHSGKNVILLDGDFRKPNVHQVLGLNNQTGLADILNRTAELYKAVQPYPGSTIGVVTAGDTNTVIPERIEIDAFTQLLDQLREIADWIIVDGPPLFVSDALVWSMAADGTLVVVRPGRTHRSVLATAIEHLHQNQAAIVGVVLNRIKAQHSRASASMRYYASYYSRYEPPQKTQKEPATQPEQEPDRDLSLDQPALAESAPPNGGGAPGNGQQAALKPVKQRVARHHH